MGAGDKVAAASVENQSFRPDLPSLSLGTNLDSAAEKSKKPCKSPGRRPRLLCPDTRRFL
jgi:hypothetical protein